eukprot:TRINITY_DN13340_c0_g1_i1.p2 TRINITY_DN13340_c0_g1~~TRINITY_DN13340_c0_g1_i1.p2  ORF type:complete len:131 (+),score=12.89 TRINITY_DN13340_c0_g1_i1:662-1054(+)
MLRLFRRSDDRHAKTVPTRSISHSKPRALEYIGSRVSKPASTRKRRIKFARDVLLEEMLPHVGIGEHSQTKKGYFFGYVIHRLLLCAPGRREEDDRDRYANKRLDLTGSLLEGLFRTLFRKLVNQEKFYI